MACQYVIVLEIHVCLNTSINKYVCRHSYRCIHSHIHIQANIRNRCSRDEGRDAFTYVYAFLNITSFQLFFRQKVKFKIPHFLIPFLGRVMKSQFKASTIISVRSSHPVADCHDKIQNFRDLMV